MDMKILVRDAGYRFASQVCIGNALRETLEAAQFFSRLRNDLHEEAASKLGKVFVHDLPRTTPCPGRTLLLVKEAQTGMLKFLEDMLLPWFTRCFAFVL